VVSARLLLTHADLTPARLAGLMARHGSPERVLAAIRATVPDPVGHLDAGDVTARLDRVGAWFVAGDDPRLPSGLRDLPDPPVGLFVRGSLPDGPAVAVIGTRRCTPYGLALARALGAGLAGAGATVVSGLARGVDGAAHTGTVAAGGTALAVLGCGIDRWYPGEHRKLGEQMVATGGAVVSEYPPGRAPEAWRFPVRNRLIAAWSEAVVVVEAGATGGALITARIALELGREVLAVPGDIDRPASVGTNLLIRDGAHPVLGVEDLLTTLELAGLIARRGDAVMEPSGPVSVETWLGRLGLPVADGLAELARLEREGAVEVRSGMVVPRGEGSMPTPGPGGS
jgi:DNA protecting protein DprA